MVTRFGRREKASAPSGRPRAQTAAPPVLWCAAMARRQEQEAARPEVAEVAPNVLRMQLPIRMPGLGHVNCYAILDARGAAVVDPGLPGPGTWRAIQDRLRQADLEVRHVHTVIVTHSHPDHFGGAARFAKETGAAVVAHRSFSFGPSVAARALPEVSVEDLAAPARRTSRPPETLRSAGSATARPGAGSGPAPLCSPSSSGACCAGSATRSFP